MRDPSASDPLALWRGIDDAVWREAARPTWPEPPVAPVLAATVGDPLPATERRSLRAPAHPRGPLLETV